MILLHLLSNQVFLYSLFHLLLQREPNKMHHEIMKSTGLLCKQNYLELYSQINRC